MIELHSADARVEIDETNGGRVASLQVAGRDLLVGGGPASAAMRWGSYPMVPWAGRVRRGRFTFEGVDHELPINLDQHAIHGTCYERAWERIGEASLRIGLGPDWPFGGVAVQHFALGPSSLTCVLEVHAADRPMPASIGWHPWFVKPDELVFSAGAMYLRDDDYIPTGITVPTPPGPWDDCFTDIRRAPRLRWDDLHLAISSTCDHWVCFDQPEHATCVEPQSGPPDAFTIAPEVVMPGSPLVHSMTWTWWSEE